jgi:hypothetical protein
MARLSFYTVQLAYSLASLDPNSFGPWRSTDRRWFYNLLKSQTINQVKFAAHVVWNHTFALNWFAEIAANERTAAFAAGRCPCTVIAYNKTVFGHVALPTLSSIFWLHYAVN